MERKFYIQRTRPHRDERTLRAENISDEEIRQIELAVGPVMSKALLNIGAVTDSCPCEEGPLCSSQVWVVASTSQQTLGLMFSKINGRWDIGVVQKWWQLRDALDARMPQGHDSSRKSQQWYEEQEALYDAFPVCMPEEKNDTR